MSAVWRARPTYYPRTVWLLVLVLDVLPWPWGENLFTNLGVVSTMVRPRLWRRALAWASAQNAGRRWRLAAAVCASRVRWGARAGLLGLRSPEQLGRHIVVRGEEHLTARPGGVLLLGFHLGPPGVDVALRIVGHRVAWFGLGARNSPGWWRDAWRRFLEPGQYLCSFGKGERWPGLIQRARRILLDGGRVFMTADGNRGRELCRVPLPGGAMIIRQGWLALQRHTGATVLPVMTHLEGRTQVVTIHPPLPVTGPEQVERWRAILAPLLEDYVRQHPGQCHGLAFK